MRTYTSDELDRMEKLEEKKVFTSNELDSMETPLGNEWDKMGGLQKFADILGRPGYMVKSMVSNNMDKFEEIWGRGDINEFQKLYLIKNQFQTSEGALESGWKGLSGEERISANQLWERVGVKNVPLLGFATEMLLDPLSYGGYGLMGKGVRKGVVGITRPMLKSKLGQKGIAGVKPFTTWVADRFITKSPIKPLANMVDDWLSQRRYIKGKGTFYAAKTKLAIKSIAKKNRMSEGDVQKRIVNIIELRNHPDELAKVVKGVTREELVIANTLKSKFEFMLTDEIKAGVPIRGLASAKKIILDKTRRKLNLIRQTQARELEKMRGKLIREIDTTAELKTDKIIKGYQKKQKVITKSMLQNKSMKIKKLDEAVKGIERQMSQLEKHRKYMIKTGKHTRVIDNELDKLENQYWYLHGELADRLQDTGNLVYGGKYLKQIDEIEGLLSEDITVGLGKGIVDKVNKLKNIKVGQLKSTPIGIPVGKSKRLLKELTVMRAKRDFGYVPRITTDEAIKYLQQTHIGKTKVWSTQLKHALKRRTEDFTIDEFNSYVEGLGLKSLGGQAVESFFVSDPAYAIAVRSARSAKAITSARFLQDVGEMFGKKTAPLNWVELNSNVTRLNPSLKGLFFKPDVAREIGNVSEFYINPKYISRGEKAFDTLQNIWKKWQLAIFPKYHLRNVVGNLWNNHLADVGEESYKKATALQLYRKHGLSPKFGEVIRRNLKQVGLSVDDANKIIHEGEVSGVIGGGWFGADIEGALEHAVGKGNVVTKLLNKGMDVGTMFENNARLAHFVDRMSKGDDYLKAALSVKKFLFDYGDLTHFERMVMKRIAPFYTWTRKNIPLQLENLMKQPEKYAPVLIPLRNRNANDLLSLKYSNKKVYDRLPVEMKRTIDTVTYIPLEGLIPAGDLIKLGNPGDLIMEMLTPAIKYPIEGYLNMSTYYKNKIRRYDGQMVKFMGVRITPEMKHMLTTINPLSRLFREFDKIVKKKDRKETLTMAEQTFDTSLGTVYKMNIRDLKNKAIINTVNKIKEISLGIRQEGKTMGNEKQISNLYKYIDRYKRLLEKLK